MALRLRRGTDADRQGIYFLEGELIYCTDTKELWVGDGATPGGVLVSAELSDDLTPQLGGNLDLSGHNIVGTGNISIDGTITATGTVNLGDGVEDNVIVGGQIGSSLFPNATATHDLGGDASRWRNVYAVNGEFSGGVTVGDLLTDGSIIRTDSSVIYNGDTDTLVVGTVNTSNLNAVAIDGDLTGSVFGDDSTLILDAISNTLHANVENRGVQTNDIQAAVITLEGSRDIDGQKAGIRINTDGNSEDLYSLFTIVGRNDSDIGQALVLERGRGTHDVPAALQDGDEIASITWFGLDSDVASNPAAGFKVSVDGAPSSGVVPGKLELLTAGASGIGGIAIDSNQVVDFTVDNTVTADGGSGTADVSGGVATWLKIKVAGTEYAMPLYAINP